MKQNIPKQHDYECFWGEKIESPFGLVRTRSGGGELNVLKLAVEANCSIHLVQKWQSIFITHVTCLWIPMVTEQRADLHKINHSSATASWSVAIAPSSV
jgi:hypothetical protein